MAVLPLVIIGTGFTAASLAYQLLQKYPSQPLHIIGTGHLGAGQAYGTDNPYFRLNVRANLQGLFPDPVDDFEKWAARHIDDEEAQSDAGLFYKRADFRRYIDETLADCQADKFITRHHQQAIDIAPVGNEWQITLEDKSRLQARQIYICIGNAASVWPCPIDESAKPYQDRLIASAWRGDFFPKLMADAPDDIAIIGGGLTAYDCINALYHEGYQGQIHIITPKGILPPRQANWQHGKPATSWPKPLNAYHFISHIKSILPRDVPWTEALWQSRFEALRLILPEGWAMLSAKDKQKVMRRCGALWSLARYRAGPQAVASGDALLREGRLHLYKDRIAKISHDGTEFLLSARASDIIKAGAVINATGTAKHDLCDKLIGKGFALADGLGLAVAVNERCQILNQDGMPWQSLYMVGPPTMADRGDIIGAFSTARQIASII